MHKIKESSILKESHAPSMLSLWASAEPAGEVVAVGKGPQQLWWVKLEKEEKRCGWWGWLSPTQLLVLLGSCGWYRRSRGTRMAPQKSSGTAETLPYTLFKLQGEEGLLQYGFSALQSTHSSGVGSPRLWDVCARGKAQRGCGQSSGVGWF